MLPHRGMPHRNSLPQNRNSFNTNQSDMPYSTSPVQQQNVYHAEMGHNFNNIGAMAAQALTATLANPYGQMSAGYASYTNPNYHAYFTQMQQRQMTTAEGYTLSSTYIPTPGPSTIRPQRGPPNSQGQHSNRPLSTQTRPNTLGPWFTPGDVRCTQEGCSFTASQKSLEIHMMDRHLIFPPGWKKNKKKDDWDADPSLKG